jgi:twitching motility protein PilT
VSSNWEQTPGSPEQRRIPVAPAQASAPATPGGPAIRPWTGGSPAVAPQGPNTAPFSAPTVPVAQPSAAPAPTGPPLGYRPAPASSPELGSVASDVRAWAERQGAPAQPPAAPSLQEQQPRAASAEDDAADGTLLLDLLGELLDRKGSDLHISAGARPSLRINGSLAQLEHRSVLTPQAIQRMLFAIITQRQREQFEEAWELDFAYSLPGRSRFRVNLLRQRDSLGAVFRAIPFEIKPLEALGVPPVVANFAMLPRGFALVTGPTGSGKSTTLASIVDLANRQRADHIMTVEDPIEFLHKHNKCIVNQREVGEDTHSFTDALKHALRQDPDIILVGELRDLETISVALTAAETGHLVFGTLHTQDAGSTIDRVIDVFPPHQQQQIRAQLAGVLQGVVCQTLCKTADGRGRVVACEIMICTPAIRNLIREGKTHQIPSAMQSGGAFGMQTLDQHLAELTRSGQITYETAVEKCNHVDDLDRLLGRG